MPQTPHPLDMTTDNLGRVRRMLIRAFMADRKLDAHERAALEAFDAERGTILEYRLREVAADSYKRNGDTDLTRRRFREAGHDLIDLATERQARRNNVVPLFPPDRNAG